MYSSGRHRKRADNRNYTVSLNEIENAPESFLGIR